VAVLVLPLLRERQLKPLLNGIFVLSGEWGRIARSFLIGSLEWRRYQAAEKPSPSVTTKLLAPRGFGFSFKPWHRSLRDEKSLWRAFFQKPVWYNGRRIWLDGRADFGGMHRWDAKDQQSGTRAPTGAVDAATAAAIAAEGELKATIRTF